MRGMWPAFIAGVLYQCRSTVEVARLLGRDKNTRQMPALLKKADADKALSRPQAEIADKGYDSLLIAVSMT